MSNTVNITTSQTPVTVAVTPPAATPVTVEIAEARDAYQLAVAAGFAGTLEAWLESLISGATAGSVSALPDTVALRDGAGGSNFAAVVATSVSCSGDLDVNGESVTIATSGANATIRTIGQNAHINTYGANATIRTYGDYADIYTSGENAHIHTYGATANIYTQGQFAFIQTRSVFKLYDGTNTTSLYHSPSGDRVIVFPDANGTIALTNPSTGTQTFSGEQVFDSTTRPTSSGTGTPAANSLVTRADVETLSVSAIPAGLSLKDSFVGGGTGSGTIGDLGWSITGTGAAWARRGSAGLLVPPATITPALVCGSIGFNTGDYFGAPTGIATRSTSSFVTLLSRITLSPNTVTNKPPSWVFGFGASPSAGAIPNRIIPANSAGIAAIPPANFNWTAATSFAVGATVNGGGFRQVCTTAGTSSAAAPTWPTTHGGTVTEAGGPTWTNCGMSGQAAFLFFVTAADPLVNIAVANSTVNIPLTNAVVNYDLKIQSTASGYLFSVNSETAVLVADTASLTAMPFFAVRNDTAQTASASILQLKHFGFYSDNR